MVSRTLKITALIGVIMLTLATTVLLTLDFGFIREPLSSAVSQAIGRPFAIDGPLTIRIGKTIHIEAHDMRLAASTVVADTRQEGIDSAAPVPRQDMLHIRQITLNLPFEALFSRPIIINTVRISDVDVKTSTADNSAAADIDSRLDDPDDLVQRPEYLPVFVRKLRITNVNWRHDDPTRIEPWHVHLSSIDQQLQGDSHSGNVVVRVDGEVNKTSINLQLSAQPLNNLLQLKTTEFKANGQLGEIAFTGNAHLDDLLQPGKPELSLQLMGPSLEYLTDLLGLQTLSRGPLKLNISVAPLLDKMQFNIDGQFGELLVLSTGKFDSLQAMNDIDLSVSASGPNAKQLNFLPGLSKLPNVPFGADIKLSKMGNQLLIDASQLTVGRLVIKAEGNIPDIRTPGQANIKTFAQAPNIGIVGNMFDFPSGLAGPASVQLSVNTQSNEKNAVNTRVKQAIFDAKIATDYGQLDAQGTLSATQDLSGSTLHLVFDTDTPNILATALGADLPHLEPLHLQSDLQINTQALVFSGGKLRVGSHTGDFTGNIQLSDRKGTAANATIAEFVADLKGEDLATSLRLLDAPAALHQSFTLSTSLDITTTEVKLHDFNGEIGGNNITGSIDFNVDSGQLAAKLTGHSTDILRWAPLQQLDEAADKIPLDFSLDADWNAGLLTLNGLSIDSPAVTASGSGNLRGLPHFDGSDIQLTLDISDLSKFSPLLGQTLPAQALTLTAAATGSPSVLDVHTFNLKSGVSDLTGSASITQPHHPKLQLVLTSELIDIRPFLVALPEEASTAVAGKAPSSAKTSPKAKAATKETKPKKTRLIPDSAIDISILKKFDADIDLHVKALHVTNRLLSDVSLAALVAEGAVHISHAALTNALDGTLLASGSLAAKEDEHQLALRLQGRDIHFGIFAQSEEQLAKMPRYQVQLAAVSHGNTVREMFANSDGFARIEGGKGQYPAGNIQLLTNSFIDELLNKLNPFRKRGHYLDVNCSVVIAKLEQGELNGNPLLVLNSKRLNIFASAKVDFKTEKIAITFKTIPQKGLGISVSNLINPFIGIGGTLAHPYLTLNPEQSLITGSAAVATGGLSILATTFFDRFLSESDPCGAALKKDHPVFLALAKKYGVEKPL